MFTPGAKPRYAVYPKRFVDRVRAATGNGSLAHKLAWNMTTDLEESFQRQVLECPQARVAHVRALYDEYKEFTAAHERELEAQDAVAVA